MFGARYFGTRHFGARYFGHTGAVLPSVRGVYLGPRYFGRRYWNQKSAAVDGAYNGSRYFGNRYFGKRYFGANQTSNPSALTQTNILAASAVGSFSSAALNFGISWPITQTNTLAGTSAASINAALSFDSDNWYLENYLTLAQTSATGAFSATLAYNQPVTGGVGAYFGPHYFGKRYYGPRYWSGKSDWLLEQTSSFAGNGASTISSLVGTQITLNQSGVIVCNGAGAYSAALGYPSQTQPVIVVGAPGGGHGKRYFNTDRYLVIIDGEKHYGTKDEIERLIRELAEERAEKPKRKKPRISVKPIEKPADAAPEAKVQAAEIQTDMRETYAELYRRALANLELQEEEDIVGLL